MISNTHWKQCILLRHCVTVGLQDNVTNSVIGLPGNLVRGGIGSFTVAYTHSISDSNSNSADKQMMILTLRLRRWELGIMWTLI